MKYAVLETNHLPTYSDPYGNDYPSWL